ncbi:MAG: alpha-glucuronidase [Reichenbachiella sp.]
MLLSILAFPFSALSEDGHDLWLRYKFIEIEKTRNNYSDQIPTIHLPGKSETHDLIKKELITSMEGMLGTNIPFSQANVEGNQLIIGTKSSLKNTVLREAIDNYEDLGEEGYLIKTIEVDQSVKTVISANSNIGLLYGTFHLLRLMQNQEEISSLNILEIPKIDIRMLNHWDNLDRTSERGYAGFALWDWHRLPEYIDPVYKQYARANASIGINATVLVNVNSNALVLSPLYLKKVKAMADLFRPYGIKMYLTARFSAPMEIGGFKTADPLDQAVISWWEHKVKEIYEYVPDFGGFLVKANSEGQPGPNDYGRNHAEGANMLATALESYGGVVMWRAFVYSEDDPDDRHKQAYTQFVPLDGTFKKNVNIQVKNGAIDFQPREPFHPLFGAMPKTPLMMEFQITQEYLGQATQLVFMGPYYKECMDSDTYVEGKGSFVSKVIDGTLQNASITGIAGVANIGTDRNWTGHLFGQSNWYAFGRLAWNPNLSAELIADEWIGMTFSPNEEVRIPIKNIMMSSREAAVNYMTPLGLHHLMATNHHYGPGPWVNNLPRPEWNPVYYHKADEKGIGFDRTKKGTNALSQYAKPIQKSFGNLKTCPEKYLLWFHHVPWNYKMRSGKNLWNEMCLKYQEGVDSVRSFKKSWISVQKKIDVERFESVQMLLDIHEKEAIWWKDASLLYFQTFSKQPFPSFIDPPQHTLEYYQSLKFPYAPGIKPTW